MVRFFSFSRSPFDICLTNKVVLRGGFLLPHIGLLQQATPHVRRRCRQHAQVAQTFKATVRCDALVVLFATTLTAFPSIPLGQ
jgi:hypothetical protein